MSKVFFEIGKRYRAKCEFEGDLCVFGEGEILVFRKEGFNRYDEAYVFEFDASDGTTKAWMVYNQLPLNWNDYFEPADGASCSSQ